jgi:hypothetical protein
VIAEVGELEENEWDMGTKELTDTSIHIPFPAPTIQPPSVLLSTLNPYSPLATLSLPHSPVLNSAPPRDGPSCEPALHSSHVPDQ